MEEAKTPETSKRNFSFLTPSKSSSQRLSLKVKKPYTEFEKILVIASYTQSYVNDLKLNKVINVGGYNCAILTNSNEIYRIRKIRNEHEIKQINRALAILTHFNEPDNLFALGPAVLRLNFNMPGQFITELPDNVKYSIKDSNCESRIVSYDKDEKLLYFEQIMQYVNSGDLFSYVTKKRSIQFDEIIFIIIWFVMVAQKLFGFQHKDLKLENILIQEHQKTKDFTFVLDDKIKFNIYTKFVPIIIDYDQASFSNSETHTHISFYTDDCTPPDVFISFLINNEEEENQQPNLGFDWWSVGIICLTCWVGGSVIEYIRDGLSKQNIINRFALDITGYTEIKRLRNEKKDVVDLCEGMLIGTFIQLLCLEIPDESIKNNLYAIYRAKKQQKEKVDILFEQLIQYKYSDNFIKLGEILSKGLNYAKYELIGRLLNYEPTQRFINKDQLENLSFFKTFVPSKKEPKIFTFNEKNERKRYDDVESNICVNCQAPAIWPSVVNSKIYCGNECREKRK